MTAVEYLKNKKVQNELKTNAGTYQKKEETMLRLPNVDEINSRFATLVKDSSSPTGIRQESVKNIESHEVIARNPQPIGYDAEGKELYNEWLVPSETIRKNYGEDTLRHVMASEGFTSHRKQAKILAMPLTTQLIEELTEGMSKDTLHIKVDWSDEPMVAKVGDYITSGGYSISAHDMLAYEKIAEAPKPKEPEAPSFDR